jgi:hypothetical protein
MPLSQLHACILPQLSVTLSTTDDVTDKQVVVAELYKHC